MTIEPLFTVPDASAGASVTIVFEGRPLRVPAGITVAAALLVGGVVTSLVLAKEDGEKAH